MLNNYFKLLVIATSNTLKKRESAGVKLCQRSDDNFQACVSVNMRDAIPLFAEGSKELGLPLLEPFTLELLEIHPVSGGAVALDHKYTNMKVYGGTELIFENMNLDLDSCKWVFTIIWKNITITSDYELKGHVLAIPLDSRGKNNMTFVNLVDKNTILCEKYTKDNEEYMRITDYKMDMKADKFILGFSDLFAGDRRISDEILVTLNENSLPIFQEVKPAVEQAFSAVFKKDFNTVLSQIPIRNIFLD